VKRFSESVDKFSGIRKMASGGIVSKPTIAMIGEGNEPEAVFPQSKLENFVGKIVGATADAKQGGSSNDKKTEGLVSSLQSQLAAGAAINQTASKAIETAKVSSGAENTDAMFVKFIQQASDMRMSAQNQLMKDFNVDRIEANKMLETSLTRFEDKVESGQMSKADYDKVLDAQLKLMPNLSGLGEGGYQAGPLSTNTGLAREIASMIGAYNKDTGLVSDPEKMAKAMSVSMEYDLGLATAKIADVFSPTSAFGKIIETAKLNLENKDQNFAKVEPVQQISIEEINATIKAAVQGVTQELANSIIEIKQGAPDATSDPEVKDLLSELVEHTKNQNDKQDEMIDHMRDHKDISKKLLNASS
jgi:hypothetical protein